MDEGGTRDRAGMDQIGKVFSLHDTDVFQSGNGVVAQLESPLLDSGEPSSKAGKIERGLFPGIHEENGTRRPAILRHARGIHFSGCCGSRSERDSACGDTTTSVDG